MRTPGTPPASPGLVVRPATPADAEAVTRLCDELNEHEGEPVGHFTPELVRRDGFGRTPPEFRIFLAVLDGEPAGYAMFHPSYSSEWGQRGVYLQDLFVRPAARRGRRWAGTGRQGPCRRPPPDSSSAQLLRPMPRPFPACATR